MVPRIPPMPYRKVHRILVRHGFFVVRQRGSHIHYRDAAGRRTVVPRHPGDLDGEFIAMVLEQAGIDPDTVRR